MFMPTLSYVPIRVSVPILLALPVLLVAVVLSLLSYYEQGSSARDLTRQQLLQTHERIEGHLNALLDAPGRINRVNAALIAEGRLPLADIGSWRDTLIAQLQAYDMLSSIVWGGADGQATWICRYAGDTKHTYYAIKDAAAGDRMAEYRVGPDGRPEAEPSGTFDFDPRERPWYKASIQAGRAAWCEPFLWIGGGDASEVTLGISYGQPIHDDSGNLAGVIDADLSLNDISHYLARLRIGKTGGAYVVDAEGLIIASSTGADLATPDGNRVAAMASSQPRIAETARHLQETAGSFAALEEHFTDTITVEGMRLLLIASPYMHATGLKWKVVTLVPEQDFLANVYRQRNRNVLLGAAAAGLTLLLGLAVSLFLVRPVLAVTHHARQIGEGQLDREIHLTQSPEWIRLSDEMNAMAAGLRDRLRMRYSLAVAMEVQQALLPSDPPRVQGLDVAGHSTYCDETGGDYYDFLDVSGIEDHAVAVAVGDVMGHGVAAAMLMATARGILRSRSQEPHTLSDLLDHVNRMLVGDTGGTRFMTMLLLILDSREKTLRWAAAGHEPPFIYDPADDSYRELEGAGLPLGISEQGIYEQYEYAGIRSGQVLFAGTDGVWETAGATGESFGKERLRELLQRHHSEPAARIAEHIRDALAAFRDECVQDDDVTFVVIRVL